MALPPICVRRISGVAVIGVGPHAAGEPLDPKEGLPGALAGCRGVLFDMVGSRQFSSELIGMMIRAHQIAMRSGVPLRMCCPQGEVREMLSAVNLHNLMPVYDTLAEALAEFDPPAE